MRCCSSPTTRQHRRVCASATTVLDPSDLTVLGAEALFSGLDTGGDTGLWETDGRIGGTTQELTGIKDIRGVAVPDLHPRFLTAFEGKVLFNGLDSGSQEGLWVTDGTAGGTHELAGIVGAQTTGVGFDPTGFEVYNGVVLFNGIDSNGHNELWETDGTCCTNSAPPADFVPKALIRSP